MSCATRSSSDEVEDDGEGFETKMKRLTADLSAQMDQWAELDAQIRKVLGGLGMPSEFDSLPQAKKFHAPLQRGDTEDRTVGCRHTCPSICRNNGLPGACAFVREDGMCDRPPRSWVKQFKKLVG